MKKISLFLALMLVVSMLAGCAGTPVVYYTNCTCPVAEAPEAPAATEAPAPAPTEAPGAPVEGALKTGLYISTSVAGSKAANGEELGEAAYDVTMVAVLVDDAGVIQDCIIDGVSTSVSFDAAGALKTDLSIAPKTKNELGSDYGMVAWGQAKAEWNEQAAAFADYVVGKTVEEVKGIAVDADTKPTEADLTASVTIKVGGFMSAIEQAVANARHLGAQGGDELRLAAINGIGSSTAAAAEAAGNAQLDCDVTALTVKDGVITSCYIDSVQAKVAFDTTGAVASDVTAAVKTKNELGSDYGMVAWGQAIAEWNEQAASFASYVTGKTAEEVMGIAVNEGTKPAEADLAASVTIAIGGFQALIQKAAQ